MARPAKRTRKNGVGTGTKETLYLHNGEMPIEQATYYWSATRGNYSEIVRNGLGARGIDVMERVKTGTGAGTFYSYPVYDGHGNMIATLSKNGTGFSFGNQRAFDPWGTVRMWLSGGYAGFPSGRHCASIGHQMDDESGLVYMRARYYEAGSGRFISEDPGRDGGNYYAYCGNNPVNQVDATGLSADDVRCWSVMGMGMAIGAFALIFLLQSKALNLSNVRLISGSFLAAALMFGAIAAYTNATNDKAYHPSALFSNINGGIDAIIAGGALLYIGGLIATGASLSPLAKIATGAGAAAAALMFDYAMKCVTVLIWINNPEL